MFGILISALNTGLTFMVRSLIAKFFLFFALYFITTEFLAVLGPMLPTASGLNGAFGGITADMWYWLDLFQISAGLPAVISAWVMRFVIRRLPVIG